MGYVFSGPAGLFRADDVADPDGGFSGRAWRPSRVFVGGFLFDANILAPMVLPAATDPPDLGRFLAGHVLAVPGSGLFAPVLTVALKGVVLAALGERLFQGFLCCCRGFQ